ncbi:hypothetical protein ACLOJK_005499 [Asimina triloba]
MAIDDTPFCGEGLCLDLVIHCRRYEEDFATEGERHLSLVDVGGMTSAVAGDGAAANTGNIAASNDGVAPKEGKDLIEPVDVNTNVSTTGVEESSLSLIMGV